MIIDVKETEKTNIKILKAYFNDKRNKSFEDKKEAGMAIGDIIFYTDDIGDVYFNWGVGKAHTPKTSSAPSKENPTRKKLKICSQTMDSPSNKPKKDYG